MRAEGVSCLWSKAKCSHGQGSWKIEQSSPKQKPQTQNKRREDKEEVDEVLGAGSVNSTDPESLALLLLRGLGSADMNRRGRQVM